MTRLTYTIEVKNPKGKSKGVKSLRVDGAKVASLGPALAVAVGLALRGFDQ